VNGTGARDPTRVFGCGGATFRADGTSATPHAGHFGARDYSPFPRYDFEQATHFHACGDIDGAPSPASSGQRVFEMWG
jgi:hypothetical protein